LLGNEQNGAQYAAITRGSFVTLRKMALSPAAQNPPAANHWLRSPRIAAEKH
jgi:hypothetical protein